MTSKTRITILQLSQLTQTNPQLVPGRCPLNLPNNLGTWYVTLTGIYCAHLKSFRRIMKDTEEVTTETKEECKCSGKITKVMSCQTTSFTWKIERDGYSADDQDPVGIPISGCVNQLIQRLQELDYNLMSHNEFPIANNIYSRWTFKVTDFIADASTSLRVAELSDEY